LATHPLPSTRKAGNLRVTPLTHTLTHTVLLRETEKYMFRYKTKPEKKKKKKKKNR